MNDALGDRMKGYEGAEEKRMMPLLPTFARVDGKCFSAFTKGLKRPFDDGMANAMLNTTIYLARETNACMAYTQSDEITLCWLSKDSKSQIWFDGRHSKMVSVIASMATLQFYCQIQFFLGEDFWKKMPVFDARVWQVPSRVEGANTFLWREMDATKNSISMAAHRHYSPKQLLGKNGKQKQEMLFQKGINWNDYPTFFKRGVFVQRRTKLTPFATEEIEKLPPKHEARANPDLIVERQEWVAIEMPPFRTVKNREDVIFEGAQPSHS